MKLESNSVSLCWSEIWTMIVTGCFEVTWIMILVQLCSIDCGGVLNFAFRWLELWFWFNFAVLIVVVYLTLIFFLPVCDQFLVFVLCIKAIYVVMCIVFTYMGPLFWTQLTLIFSFPPSLISWLCWDGSSVLLNFELLSDRNLTWLCCVPLPSLLQV